MKLTYIEHMGTDLSVCNAARASFGKKSEWEVIEGHPLDTPNPEFDWMEIKGIEGDDWHTTYYRLKDADRNLIYFLARGMSKDELDIMYDEMNDAFKCGDDFTAARLMWRLANTDKHWAPFAHPQISIHYKLPLFVFRQLQRSEIGRTFSEESRRYVDSDPTYYAPTEFRRRAKNIKQGSSDDVVTFPDYSPWGLDLYDNVIEAADNAYKAMLDMEVCPEQARMHLPQSTYVEGVMTGSLLFWARVYNQRSSDHAQREIQKVADQIKDIVQPLFPVSWSALTTDKAYQV